MYVVNLFHVFFVLDPKSGKGPTEESIFANILWCHAIDQNVSRLARRRSTKVSKSTRTTRKHVYPLKLVQLGHELAHVIPSLFGRTGPFQHFANRSLRKSSLCTAIRSCCVQEAPPRLSLRTPASVAHRQSAVALVHVGPVPPRRSLPEFEAQHLLDSPLLHSLVFHSAPSLNLYRKFSSS